MKKLILTCALLTFVTMAAIAQNQQAPPATIPAPAGSPGAHPPPQMPPPEAMAERRAKMWEQRLTLTPDQYKRVYAVELGFAKSLEQSMASGQRPTREQHEKENSERTEKFKPILTPEQWTKYDAMMPKMPPPHPAVPPAAK